MRLIRIIYEYDTHKEANEHKTILMELGLEAIFHEIVKNEHNKIVHTVEYVKFGSKTHKLLDSY